MVRNFKALGLAFVAILAMGAVMASAATATTGKVVGSAGAVSVHGTQSTTHKFVLTDNSNLATTCTTATFTGNIPAGGTSTPVAHPEYSGCTAFGLGSTIVTTGCDYEFHAGTFAEAGTPASVDVECGEGAIKITTLTCEVQVKSQQGLTSNTATNKTSSDVELDTEVSGIAYSVTKDGIGCPLSGVGSFTKGDYTGTTTLTASSGTLQITK